MTALETCVRTFQKHLYLPDPGVVYAALGAIAANRMDGDPVWLLLVGAPSSGKTEILRAAEGEHDCRFVGTVTESGLLSGVPSKQRTKGSKGGLLMEIGEFGVVLLKDFTTVLSMSNDARNALLAAFREIYDGYWARTVGSDGGKTLEWKGKLGMVGGVTTAIDEAHKVMTTMGERFAFYRLEKAGPQQARVALTRTTPARIMRQELSVAMADVFTQRPTPKETPALDEETREWINSLAWLAVQIRSAVQRDNYKREIDLVHDTEAPARFALVLKQLLFGIQSIGVNDATARKVVHKIGLDSTPVIRRQAFTLLADANAPITTPDMADLLAYPISTTKRALEDMQAHGLLLLERGGGQTPHQWRATSEAVRLWELCRPSLDPDDEARQAIQEGA